MLIKRDLKTLCAIVDVDDILHAAKSLNAIKKVIPK